MKINCISCVYIIKKSTIVLLYLTYFSYIKNFEIFYPGGGDFF